MSIKPDASQVEIVSTPLVIEKEIFYANELRFYKIQAALDAMKLMCLNYGKWSKKVDGKHQQNIKRLIWENVKLIKQSNETFTVIADGAETESAYFACLIVLDSKNRNCFDKDHPYKENLLSLFTEKMSKMDRDSKVYKLFM